MPPPESGRFQKAPKPLFCDRTRQVSHDRTQHLSPILHGLPRVTAAPHATTSAYVSADQTQPLCVRSPLRPALGHSIKTARSLLSLDQTRWSSRGQRSVTHSDLFHLHFFVELIHFNSNFFLLYKCANTTKCTPTCVCVLAFHKHFKELATQLATLLDPSGDANLNNSSGTR